MASKRTIHDLSSESLDSDSAYPPPPDSDQWLPASGSHAQRPSSSQIPLGSSQPADYDNVVTYDELDKKLLMWHEVSTDPSAAAKLLSQLKMSPPSASHRWCRIVNLQPSKDGGYIQVSWKGANKFALLQEVAMWSAGRFVRPGLQHSHLCGQPACAVPEHIIEESGPANNARKGCVVWVDCPHCGPGGRKLLVCQHTPPCIRSCPGYGDNDVFLREGLCARPVLGGAVGAMERIL
jgi:hypothetical protein